MQKREERLRVQLRLGLHVWANSQPQPKSQGSCCLTLIRGCRLLGGTLACAPARQPPGSPGCRRGIGKRRGALSVAHRLQCRPAVRSTRGHACRAVKRPHHLPPFPISLPRGATCSIEPHRSLHRASGPRRCVCRRSTVCLPLPPPQKWLPPSSLHQQPSPGRCAAPAAGPL